MNLTQDEITAILVRERDAEPSQKEAEMVKTLSENPQWAAFNDSGVEYLADRLLNGGFKMGVTSANMGAALLGYKLGLAEAEKREQSKNATSAA